jgi:hypothetical protein
MSALDPMVSRLLGLTGDRDEKLEDLSTAELELIHAVERQRLGLTRKVCTGAGILGSLAARRFLIR